MPDGHLVRLGDHLTLDGNSVGMVVCSIDTNEYTDKYPKEQWNYLERGILVEFPSFGLMHYVSPEPDLRLVR